MKGTMYMYLVISGIGKGLICTVDFDIKGKSLGNCMCYPIAGSLYRICKSIKDIRKI